MYVALLRGINVGGNRKVPMAELRALVESLGLTRVRTLIASGNLVFEGEGKAEALEGKLEAGIEKHFGFAVDVIVRTAAQWSAYIAANPFPGEGAQDPSKLMMTLGKRSPTDADVALLLPRAAGGEKIERASDAIWLWLPDGAGRSKLAAGLSGKTVWTARNWRTVLAIKEMLCSPSR
jgi:uncharacterized protein (DUF1697 family)